MSHERVYDRLHADSHILQKSSKSTLVASVLRREDFIHQCADGVNRISDTQAHMEAQLKALTERVAALEASLIRVSGRCEEINITTQDVHRSISAQRIHTETLGTAVSRLDAGQARMESELTRMRRAHDRDEEEAELARMHARAATLRAQNAQEARLAVELDVRLQETEDLILDEFEDLHGVLGPRLGYRRCAHPPGPATRAPVPHMGPGVSRTGSGAPRTPPPHPQQQPTPSATPVRATCVPLVASSAGSGSRPQDVVAERPSRASPSLASNASSRSSASSGPSSSPGHASRSASRPPQPRDTPRRSRAPSSAPTPHPVLRSSQDSRYPDLTPNSKQVGFTGIPSMSTDASVYRAQVPAHASAPMAGAFSSTTERAPTNRPRTHPVAAGDPSGSDSRASSPAFSMDERQRQSRASLMRASGYTAGPKTPRDAEEEAFKAERARAQVRG